jgi:hypothetical protein
VATRTFKKPAEKGPRIFQILTTENTEEERLITFPSIMYRPKNIIREDVARTPGLCA